MQGRAGQDRKAWDNAKGNALGNIGHSALQDKAKENIDCGTAMEGSTERTTEH